MGSLSYRKRLCFVLGFAACVCSAPALAQSEPTDAQQQAQRLSEDAGALFFDNKFSEALKLFTQAYELTHAPSLLYSMGLCQQKLGDNKSAQASFCEYLSTTDTMRRTEAASALAKIATPGEALCPIAPTSKPTQEIAPPSKALPIALFFVGGASAAGVFWLRVISPNGPQALLARNIEPNKIVTKSNHTAGLTLSLTADLSLLAGGVTLFLHHKKKATTITEAP